MQKIIVLSLLMAFAGASQADHQAAGVNIEKIEKIIVNKGISSRTMHRDLMKMMKCMLLLKKYNSAEEAIEAKMARVNEKCDKAVIPAKKCHKIKKKIAMGIYGCFTKAEFVREFFKSKSETQAAPVAPPAAPEGAPAK